MSKKKLILINDDGESVLWLPEKILLTLPAYGEMLLAALLCPVEVSGYAEVTAEDNVYKVSDVIIPHQVCSKTSTTSLSDNLHSAMQEIVEQGKDPGDFCLWWHSHVEDAAQFSPTDFSAIDKFQRYLLQGNRSKIVGPWLSLVLNRRAEVSGRCDFARPALSLRDLPVVLDDGVSQEDVTRYLDIHYARVEDTLRARVSLWEDGR